MPPANTAWRVMSTPLSVKLLWRALNWVTTLRLGDANCVVTTLPELEVTTPRWTVAVPL